MITNPELATRLAFHGEVLCVPRGAVLFDDGEAADGIYIVRSGSIRVSLLNDEATAIWTRRMSDCAILGLPAAVGDRPHCLRAVADDSSELVFVRSNTIRVLMSADPPVGAQIVRLISEELQDLRRKTAMLITRPKR